MQSFPKISVVTPSYQQGNFLEETIVSVLGQGYPNLEYIVIDGGSTDNSVDVIKKYEDKIAFWISEKDNGQSHAINKGFDKATGDILCWLNSDDLHMPMSLFQMAEIADVNADVIYFGNCIHFQNTKGQLSCYGSNVKSAFNTHQLKHLDYIIQPSSFWTRRAWNKVGKLSETLHFAFDWDWFLKAQHDGISLIPVDNCLSMYRIHESHKSGTGGTRRRNELLEIVKKYDAERYHLMNLVYREMNDLSQLRFKLLRFALRSMRVNYNNSMLLKFAHPLKFKKFATKDIDECRVMY